MINDLAMLYKALIWITWLSAAVTCWGAWTIIWLVSKSLKDTRSHLPTPFITQGLDDYKFILVLVPLLGCLLALILSFYKNTSTGCCYLFVAVMILINQAIIVVVALGCLVPWLPMKL